MCSICSLYLNITYSSSSIVSCCTCNNSAHVNCITMTNNHTWTCNLCLLSVLPFNFNSDTLSSAVDNITMNSNVCKSFLSEDLLRKHMLPNALVIPSEHLLNNQDIDPDINFYNTISKGACCNS